MDGREILRSAVNSATCPHSLQSSCPNDIISSTQKLDNSYIVSGDVTVASRHYMMQQSPQHMQTMGNTPGFMLFCNLTGPQLCFQYPHYALHEIWGLQFNLWRSLSLSIRTRYEYAACAQHTQQFNHLRSFEQIPTNPHMLPMYAYPGQRMPTQPLLNSASPVATNSRDDPDGKLSHTESINTICTADKNAPSNTTTLAMPSVASLPVSKPQPQDMDLPSMSSDPCRTAGSGIITRRRTPKRPMSAFLWFSQAHRPQLRAAKPTLSLGQITKILSQQWRAMSIDAKKVWFDAATSDKIRYEKERIVFERQHLTRNPATLRRFTRRRMKRIEALSNDMSPSVGEAPSSKSGSSTSHEVLERTQKDGNSDSTQLEECLDHNEAPS